MRFVLIFLQEWHARYFSWGRPLTHMGEISSWRLAKSGYPYATGVEMACQKWFPWHHMETNLLRRHALEGSLLTFGNPDDKERRAKVGNHLSGGIPKQGSLSETGVPLFHPRGWIGQSIIIAGKYIFSIHESIDPSTSNEPTLICIFADPMWLFIENFAFIDSSWESYPAFLLFWIIHMFSVWPFFCTLIFHFLHYWLILYFLHWWTNNILQRKTQL